MSVLAGQVAHGIEQSGWSDDGTSSASSSGSHLSSLSMEAAAMEFDLLELEEIHAHHGDGNEFSPIRNLVLEIHGLNKSSAVPLAAQTGGDGGGGRETEHKKNKKLDKMKHIESLILQEFFDANSTTNCIGDVSFMEGWLRELGVGWVLRVADGTSPGELELPRRTMTWVRALAGITDIAIRMGMASFFPADSGGSVVGLTTTTTTTTTKADRFQFIQFLQRAMLKMLAFVDAVVDEVLFTSGRTDVKLSALLRVHVALSTASSEPGFRFDSPPSDDEAERIQREIASLLSAKEDKAREAIWRKLEEIRTQVLEDDDSSATQASSGGIHSFTRSVLRHITFLLDNHRAVDPIVSEAARLGKYAPQFGYLPPLRSMIKEMTTCLEEKLVSISESFPDPGLGFLFLFNNSDHLMRERLQCCGTLPSLPNCFSLHAPLDRIEAYKQRYLQVSWIPMLSYLLDPTHLCFTKNYSQLSKFESEFLKTCTAQKLWKVPNPKLRKCLRTDIIEAIVPSYTKYIEDNNVTTPKFTPKVLEEMLQELFEGC